MMLSRKEAERRGALLLERLGPGWTLRVQESCGWHYSAHQAGMTISPRGPVSSPPRYGVLLNRDGSDDPCGNPDWYVEGGFLDPREAVRAQLQRVDEVQARLSAVQERFASFREKGTEPPLPGRPRDWRMLSAWLDAQWQGNRQGYGLTLHTGIFEGHAACAAILAALPPGTPPEAQLAALYEFLAGTLTFTESREEPRDALDAPEED